MTTKTIFICTGEHSGDKLAAELATIILQQHPKWQIKALGGDTLKQAGVDIVLSNKQLDIIGFTEIIKRLPTILSIWNRIKKAILQSKPDLLICIDNPGLNLKIAKFAKKHNIPVLYYVSPQIWAWRIGRLQTIQQSVDHMAVLFPFEKHIYDKVHLPTTVVGHPMLNRLKTMPSTIDARAKLSLDTDSIVLAILPGSRSSEIQRLMPIILQACEHIHQQLPNLIMIIAKANSIADICIPAAQQHYIKVIPNQTDTIVAASNAVICASGTATLEVSLAAKPMVVVYKLSTLTYAIAKRVIKTPYVALCNIVLGKEAAKELIQHNLTAQSLAQETLQLLQNEQYAHSIQQTFNTIPAALGENHDPQKLLSIVEDLAK